MPDPHMTLVASVPAAHPYVSRLTRRCAPSAFALLADPAPAADGTWTPSPFLDAGWLLAHADSVDLVHVHFGFEHRSREELAAFAAALRSLDLPLVLTVHDLVNPHLHDQRTHLDALDVLVPAAHEVLTLTPGAALEIERRWQRTPIVVPHPHVVDLSRIGQRRPSHDGFVVGLHAKRRANNDPERVRPELHSAVQSTPGGRLQPEPTRWLTDTELWDHLAALDLLVLPYLYGTHSGLLEACFDVGTAVAVPTVGHVHQQHPAHAFDMAAPGSLTTAVHAAFRAGPADAADPRQRASEQTRVAQVHEAVYAAALESRAA